MHFQNSASPAYLSQRQDGKEPFPATEPSTSRAATHAGMSQARPASRWSKGSNEMRTYVPEPTCYQLIWLENTPFIEISFPWKLCR